MLALLVFLLQLRLPLLAQRCQAQRERVCVVNRNHLELVDHQAQLLGKHRVARGVRPLITQGLFDDGVQQHPRRVLLVAEQSRIDHGQAQQRRFQCHDGLAHSGLQAVVVQLLLHHQPYGFQAQQLTRTMGHAA